MARIIVICDERVCRSVREVLWKDILPHAVFAIFVHVTDDDIPGGSVAEWLACWTPAQKGPGSNHSLDAVLGKLFTPTVPLFTKQQNW